MFPPVSVWLPIALLAFVARLLPTLHGGGLGGIDDYDEGVYFAGAQALTAGRLPYRDFVLLHPPGILLLLVPFAALARRGVRPPGVRARQARLHGAGIAQRGVDRRRRPPGEARGPGRRGGGRSPVRRLAARDRRGVDDPPDAVEHPRPAGRPAAPVPADGPSFREFLAGVALGAAAAVKIWGVVPLVVMLGWELVRLRGGAAARVALGAAAGVTVVCLPFFLAAPGAMFRMVVLDQLERGEANAGSRATSLGDPRRWSASVAEHALRSGCWSPPPSCCALSSVAGALIDRAWLVAALLAAIVTLLMRGAQLLRALRRLCGCTPAHPGGDGFCGRWRCWPPPPCAGRSPCSSAAAGVPVVALVIAVVPITVFASVVAGLHHGTRFPGAALGHAAASSRCVTADSPGALIQMDLLGRDLERGCPVWVDVTGLTYDTAAVRRPNGAPVPRALNGPWQQALLGYLLSGNATILVRRASDGLAPSTASTIEHLPVLARQSGHTLFRVPAVR